MECDFGFIVNRVLNDTDSLTQLKIKTKWSFNESLIRLKWSRMEYHQFCSKAIVKSLIRFEREMVIEFTDNTMVLDMKYNQFYFMGWIGWDWKIKTNDYFGKVR